MQTLNPDTADTFRDFMQPQEVLEFLAGVRQELRVAWPRLEDQWRARDWAQVHKGAHRLKSLVGSVGCEVLYQALHQLENDLDATPPRLPDDAALVRLRVAATQAGQALAGAVQASPSTQPSGSNT